MVGQEGLVRGKSTIARILSRLLDVQEEGFSSGTIADQVFMSFTKGPVHLSTSLKSLSSQKDLTSKFRKNFARILRFQTRRRWEEKILQLLERVGLDPVWPTVPTN